MHQLQPTDDKTIHLEQFLTQTLVDPTLFAGRSLYLAPGNPVARRPFALVQRALERSGKWGLGRVVLSNRWHMVVVRPVPTALLLQTLYHPEQARVLPAAEPSDVTPTQAELLGHYAAGRLRFAGDGEQVPERKRPSVRPTSIQELSPRHRRVLQNRWQAIEPLTQSGLTPQENDYVTRAARLRHDGHPISARTPVPLANHGFPY